MITTREGHNDESASIASGPINSPFLKSSERTVRAGASAEMSSQLRTVLYAFRPDDERRHRSGQDGACGTTANWYPHRSKISARPKT